jgi:ABC-type phosphonate transport system ATPase subunit
MSEPRDCRCPRCHCPSGTRNPDGLCRRCSDGACIGERRIAEWVRRGTAKDETYADWLPGELAEAFGR